MKNSHLNEMEIQRYVLGKDDCDSLIIEHINDCQQCKAEVEIYKLLFAEIEKEPNPIFEFDLANLVMQRLPQNESISFDKYLIGILLGFLIFVLSILIYLTHKYFPTVFNAISSIQISSIIITILLISIFIYIDMNENYKAKMKLS